MHKLNGYCIFLFLILLPSFLISQPAETDKSRPYEKITSTIISTELSTGKALEILTELSEGVGSRLSGSAHAAKAVEWSKHKMEELGFQNVHLEPVMVPHWVRGDVEECKIVDSRSMGSKALRICALGGSIGTSKAGITAEVIEVSSFDELKALGGQAKGGASGMPRPPPW